MDSEKFLEKILEDFEEEEDDLGEEDDVEVIYDSSDDEDPEYLPSRCDMDIRVEDDIMAIEKEINKKGKEKPSKKLKLKIVEKKINQRENDECSSKVIMLEEPRLFGKDGFSWDSKSDRSQKRKIGSKNIVHVRPGPTRNVDPDPETCFRLFFTDNIIDEIVLRSNEEIKRQRKNYKTVCSTIQDTNKEEIMALVGLIIFSAAMNNNHLPSKLLFNSRYSGDCYLATTVGVPSTSTDITPPGKRKYCSICDYTKRRYTTTYCCECNVPICGQHQKKLCINCKK